jgi:antibiotic biosynthesis monooxygenase (ABM) superfamily enzyme
MTVNRILNIAAAQCPPENEAKFNEWYNEVHVPMLFKFKGMKKVTRYKLISEAQGCPAYLAVYEFDGQEDLESYRKSPEYAAAIAEMQESWSDGGFDLKWVGGYKPIKTWER